jgi:hypothetical protein
MFWFGNTRPRLCAQNVEHPSEEIKSVVVSFEGILAKSLNFKKNNYMTVASDGKKNCSKCSVTIKKGNRRHVMSDNHLRRDGCQTVVSHGTETMGMLSAESLEKWYNILATKKNSLCRRFNEDATAITSQGAFGVSGNNHSPALSEVELNNAALAEAGLGAVASALPRLTEGRWGHKKQRYGGGASADERRRGGDVFLFDTKASN